MERNNTTREPILLSIIIAVYERQDELTELLQSLVQQKCADFEVIVVDDGSQNSLLPVVDKFTNQLQIQYYYKPNSGPGLSRNYGMSKATGNYFVFLDSDTILPPHYICAVNEELKDNFIDFFGGSDSAHEDFNDLQKAISFAMTSVLTTGGIRGGKEKVGKFQPRSFNMGISREAYVKTGGFSKLRVGEDPDLSMRLWEMGFQSRWFPKATVYHKRRSTLQGFAQQVMSFGRARPILNQRHPSYASLTYWFPTAFLFGLIFSVVCSLFGLYLPLLGYALYYIALLVMSTVQYKSLKVGLLAMVTTTIQFICYGLGFLESQIKLNIFGQNPKKAFPNHYYQKS